MAHGREGPDLVMATRYVGASEIRQMTDHEENRTPDGSSAIDETRTHLNKILYGPATQQLALKKLWDLGVGRPTAQAERPYVQTVISASPAYFRDEDQGVGEWNQVRLKKWLDATMEWLRKEYGADLAHVALHLDEDTPHIHILIVPTYERKPRRPGRPAKNETLAEFDARIAAAKTSKTKRTAGRSSNGYWSKISVRREARKSYHMAIQHLGIGYGRDFVGDGEPSPTNKKTAKWVREEAARLAEDRVVSEAEIRAAADYCAKSRGEAERVKAHLKNKRIAIAHERLELTRKRAEMEKDRSTIHKTFQALQKVLDTIGDTLNITWPDEMTERAERIEQLVVELSAQQQFPLELQNDGQSDPEM